MSDEDPSVIATVAAIEDAFDGRWGVWLSDTGWWWATRTQALGADELSAGCAPFIHADNPGELKERIHQQEGILPRTHLGSDTTAPGRAVAPGTARQEAATVRAETTCTPGSRQVPKHPETPGDRLDTSVPHPARVYAYWLGGKDNCAADRRAAQEVMRLRPEVVASARANRAFLARVVRYLAADCGIRQFLDIGTGLPAPGNTHEVAQQAASDCRVVYCDNDPLVLAHARALSVSHPAGACDYIDADVRATASILTQAARILDFTRPVAVLLLAVLHFIQADDPAGVVAALADGLAPGSYVAISHLTADFAPEQVTAAAQAYNALAPVPVTPCTHTQVTALFGGLPLVAPGVVTVSEWRPRIGEISQPADLYGGLARIPGGRS